MAAKPKTVRVQSKELRELDKLAHERIWWLVDPDPVKDPTGVKMARAIRKAASDREISYIPTRWRHFVYFREVTGRPGLAQLAYGMSKRPQAFVNYYSSFGFSGVKSRSCAQVADIYINRMLGHQTFVQFLPDDGDFDQTKQCQEWESWVEGGFDQLNYWSERATMGTEALWYGTGFLGFDLGDDDNPKLGSVNLDELLYENPDDPEPYDVIWRRWARKTELLQKYKDNPAACEAIASAATAQPAFFFGRGNLDVSDIVPYLIGYTKGSEAKPGIKTVAIGDWSETKEWKYPHPFEGWQFSPMPGSVFGQGLVEQTLQVSQWIDGILSTMQEAEQRGGAGKWLYGENSNVNPDALGDTVAAAVSYLGEKPEYITPEGIGQWALGHLTALQNLLRQISHISEQAIKGEAPKSFTSGVALEKYSEIDDQNFLEKIGRLEEFDRRCAYQMLMLGQRTNCQFIRKGSDRKPIKWADLKWNPTYRIDNIQAYNVGRLSQTVAGRFQVLKEMYAEKTINKKLYIKFQQTPDIRGMFSELNSPVDDIQEQLDTLVKGDEYIPPTPYMDFAFAQQAVESRLAKEEKLKSPQEVLDRLQMWRATVLAMQKQNTTPDTPPGQPVPPPPGQGPPGMPPGAGPPGPGGFGFQPPPQQAGVAPIQPNAGPPPLPGLNNSVSPGTV